MNVLGIGGRIGAGKSSLARHLASRENELGVYVSIIPLASMVRDEIRAYALRGLNVDELDSVSDVKSTYESLVEMKPEYVYARLYEKPTRPEIRKLLQWWGTDYRRTQNPEYWVDLHANRVARFFWNMGDEWTKALIIIDDVRFPNELEYVRAYANPLTVWLERDSMSPQNHASESSVGPKDFDVVVDSNVPLEAMCEQGEKVVLDWLKNGETRSKL